MTLILLLQSSKSVVVHLCNAISGADAFLNEHYSSLYSRLVGPLTNKVQFNKEAFNKVFPSAGQLQGWGQGHLMKNFKKIYFKK